MEKMSLIIIILCQITVICAVEASGESYGACCTEPDIFTFDVNCATKELRWTSSREASFGFCYYYKCSTDDNVDYCNGLQQRCFYEYENLVVTGNTYLGQLALPNASCCFWIENVAVYRHLENHRTGCSELICCRNELPTTNVFSPTTTVPSSTLSLTSTTIVPSSALPAPSETLFVISPTPEPTALSNVTMSVNTTSSLKPTASSVTVTSSTVMPTLSMTSTPNSSSQSSISSPHSLHTSTAGSTTSLATASPSAASPSGAVLTDSSELYVILLICAIFIFMALLLTTCICLFFIYWKRSKKKKNEFEMSVKTQIENYCEDTDDLPKDCSSEVEVVIDDEESTDTTSIAEQDVTHMLRIISYGQSLLQSLISINSDREDVGIADVSATSHYCYGGSGGQTAQSNTSSHRASCSSATPLSSNT